jgi:hypothetical protein
MDNQWIAYGLDHWNLLCFLWDDTNMMDFHTVEWFNWLVKSWGSFDGDSWRVKLVKPWNYDMKPGLLKFIDCFWWFIVIDDDLNDYVWWFMMIYMIIYMIIWFKQIHVGLFWWWTKNSSHMIDAYIYIHVLFAASEIMMVPTAFRMIPFWWVKSMQPPISTIKIAIVW